MRTLRHPVNLLAKAYDGSNPSLPTNSNSLISNGLDRQERVEVDAPPPAMNHPGDNLATTQEPALSTPDPTSRASKRKPKGKPVAVVGFGSAKVPVYRCASGGRVRFAISYHRDGQRLRQFFGDLATAKKEALLVAQRIQSGMQHMTDLKPHDRESYLAARAKLELPGIPLVVAVEDYVQSPCGGVAQRVAFQM